MWAHKYQFPHLPMSRTTIEPRIINSLDDLDKEAIEAAGNKLKENGELTLKQAILMTARDIPTVTLEEDATLLRDFKKRYRKFTGESLKLVA